jgi:hypothetical protein
MNILPCGARNLELGMPNARTFWTCEAVFQSGFMCPRPLRFLGVFFFWILIVFDLFSSFLFQKNNALVG